LKKHDKTFSVEGSAVVLMSLTLEGDSDYLADHVWSIGSWRCFY